MKNTFAVILCGATTALAAVRGFNYGAQGQSQAQFEASFKTAAGLQGANDFSSARLYTMIQEGTTDTPIDAIPAALNTKTTLLLGLWASSPQSTFDHEISALKKAISQYGSAFADAVVGISVGSEDLYRISTTGIANDPLGVGQSPSVLVNYIKQVRDAIKGTSLASKPVGHVDTWNAYINGSNSALIQACDFLGLDEYPYFQTTDSNGIENAKKLFFEAYDKVSGVAPGKQIWVTEAGWPVSGKTSNLAVASTSNAATFWQDVSCELQRRSINFWWYILEDTASPSFSVSQGGKPLYDLSCHASNNTSSSAKSTSTGSRASGTGSGSSVTATGGSGARPTSGGSGTAATVSPTVSSFSGAGKLQGGVAALFVAAVIAAFVL